MLDEGFRLEASGWKGARGTAMRSATSTREFYTRLAAVAARQGWLSLYQLQAGATPVAFQFGLELGDTYFLLKPGYDETFADCSPGHLLVEDVLADLEERGIREFDFLGPEMPWKSEWTDRLRPHTWLYIFRPSLRNRVLHDARFRVGRGVWRWLRKAARWSR